MSDNDEAVFTEPRPSQLINIKYTKLLNHYKNLEYADFFMLLDSLKCANHFFDWVSVKHNKYYKELITAVVKFNGEYHDIN